MKRIFILIVSILSYSFLFAQTGMNQIIFDEMAEEEIILGYCNREGLTSDPFSLWFQPEYETYIPDMEILNQIDPEILTNVTIKVVLGTWCSDSQREIPRFVKIIDYLEFSNYSFIAVNRLKLAEETEVDELEVDLVPTFIFYLNNEEIGRIIETPEDSIEKDILNIISFN